MDKLCFVFSNVNVLTISYYTAKQPIQEKNTEGRYMLLDIWVKQEIRAAKRLAAIIF